ncbi:hypothetical protein [Promicromonospora aerolata]|uniref:Protein ImuA n=1 Tax=Promicromonospora aerolata TaxID=195749 RepID=A0ABW4V2Q9_9MICO
MFAPAAHAGALERARNVLWSAETRTGVRSRAGASVELNPPSVRLASILPNESMPRGTAVVVAGSAHFLVQLIGATLASGWVAVVGWPEINAIALSEAGADLEHAVMVPDARGRSAEVIAALLDGVDQVVVGPHVALTASEQHQLLARARRRNNTLLTGRAWENAALRMRVDRATWSGARHGDYWLREVRYDVARQARGDGRERRFMVSRGADTVRVEAVRSGARLVSVGA